MRKLVLVVIALLALFCLFRAYSEDNAEPAAGAGIRLQPGLIEVGDGTASLGLSFGLMERSADRRRLVSVLPLRVVYRNGETSISVGLNGLAFLMGGGASVGVPVVVSSPRRGDLLSVGGRVTVDARVDGDLWVVGADADLTPRAEVTGNVVVVGGKLNASPRAVVSGTVSQLRGLKVPLVGVLGTQFSAQALALAGIVLGYILFGFALFLSCFYLAAHARQMQQALPSLWRQTLITLALSLVVIPLAVVLVIGSVVGVLLLPLLALGVFLLALDGYIALCVAVGGWIRAPRGQNAPGSEESLSLFTSGLLALFLVNVPSLAGIFLTAFRSAALAQVGALLQALSLALTAAGLAYGFGTALAHTRYRVAR